MDRTVDATIPVEPEAALEPSRLARAIAELKAEARAVGLSDPDIDAELASYDAERRDRNTE